MTTLYRLSLPGAFCLSLMWVFFGCTRQPEGPPRLAVFSFYQNQNDSTTRWLAGALCETANNLLRARVAEAIVVSREGVVLAEAGQPPPTQAAARDLARGLRLDYALFGNYDRVGQQLVLHASFLDVAEDKVIHSEQLQRPLEDLFDAQMALVDRFLQTFQLAAESSLTAGWIFPASVAAYQYYNQGRDYYFQHNTAAYKQAVLAYQKAIALDSAYALAYAGLSETYLQLAETYSGDPERIELLQYRNRSMRYAEQAITLAPALSKAHRLLGRNYIVLQEWQRAEKSLEEALRLDPQDDLNYLELARLQPARFQDLGFQGRLELYQQALTLNPYSSYARLKLAEACFTAGEYERAAALYRQSMEHDPGQLDAYLGLAQTYAYQNQVEKALPYMEQALKLAPQNPTVYIQLANLHVQKGQPEQAIEIYRKGIQRVPNNADLFYNLGIVYKDRGELDEAIVAFSEALSRYKHLNACFYLAHVYEQKGNMERAAYYWRKRIEWGDPEDEWTKRAQYRYWQLLARWKGGKP